MTSHSRETPNRISTPFEREPKARVPGRGRFTSVMIAIGTILLILAAGALVVVVYDQTTTQESPTAEDAEWDAEWDIVRPEAEMNAKP